MPELQGSCVDALSLAGSSPQDEAALGSSSELFFPGDSPCWRASQSTACNDDNKELTKDSASYINRMFRWAAPITPMVPKTHNLFQQTKTRFGTATQHTIQTLM